eukprot:3656561-Amphidinium_carterae.1
MPSGDEFAKLKAISCLLNMFTRCVVASRLHKSRVLSLDSTAANNADPVINDMNSHVIATLTNERTNERTEQKDGKQNSRVILEQ